jgi:hypothetical protein
MVFVYDSSRSHVNLDDQGIFGCTSDENWLGKDLELNVKIEARTLGSYLNRIVRVFIATRTNRRRPKWSIGRPRSCTCEDRSSRDFYPGALVRGWKTHNELDKNHISQSFIT